MSIKYYTNPSKNQTIAVLDNTRFDFVNKAEKLMSGTNLCVCHSKYLMPNTYKASVYCSADDVYDEKVGREMAKKKVLDKYYRDFDRRMDMLRSEVIDLNSKIFETPVELLDN